MPEFWPVVERCLPVLVGSPDLSGVSLDQQHCSRRHPSMCRRMEHRPIVDRVASLDARTSLSA